VGISRNVATTHFLAFLWLASELSWCWGCVSFSIPYYNEYSESHSPLEVKSSTILGLVNSMAPHSSTLGWKIPWTEEPSRLQSMGSLRVGYDWATLLSLYTFMHWRRKWQPTPVFLPGESQDASSQDCGRRAVIHFLYTKLPASLKVKYYYGKINPERVFS